MPRNSLSQDEINAIKGRILEATLQIITTDGLRQLSMRKIARSLGITATTIYNYYTNIDDLYFNIRIYGFELLFHQFNEACLANDDPTKRFHEMVKRYIRFGIKYPDFYDVMYVNRRVPKYLEVVGTQIESIASKEKSIALKPFHLVIETLITIHAGDPDFVEENVLYKAIQIWCDLNGVISLLNSRLLHEVEENVDALVDRLAEDIYERYLPKKPLSK
jgi:AcrR family transcriptional regulator